MTVTRNALIPVWMAKGSAQLPEPGINVLAGLLAIFFAFWNLHVVLLGILVVAAGAMDLLVGPQEKIDRRAIDKAVYFAVSLFLGMCCDSLGALIGGMGDLQFALPIQTYTPITAAALAFRLSREGKWIVRHTNARPGGRGEVLPTLTKIIDAARFNAVHPEADATPDGRWSDGELPAGITQEDVELVMKFLAKREKGATS